MTAISRKKVKIWISALDTAPSTLQNTDVIAGEILTYNKTGGEDDVESIPVFGGFVDKEKPRSQVELSFDVIPSIGTNSARWDSYIYGTNIGGVYVMSSDAANKAIFIQAANGSDYMSYAFNNCNAVKFDIEHNADDNRTGTLSFKMSPEDENGISNFMGKAVAVTSLPNWTQLTAS